MPQLLRARYVSIGHTKARISDMILDFCDANAHPTETILRLRNGGGKSTLVSNTFAVILPDKRHFLGGKGEAGIPRQLEDYVLPNDKSLVILEWELDSSTANETPARFLTGAFYEWRSGSSEANRFRRLWFSGKVDPREPLLSLEGLPIYTETPEGTARRNLSSFREEWGALRNKYPELDIRLTENQREWHELLDQAGIDPELYYYQVRMNHREGGADAVFRFNNGAEFVDFLLELVVKPTLGELVSQNIAKHRRDLKERRHELIPELGLVNGVIERMNPLASLASDRRALLQEGAKLALDTESLQKYAESRYETLKRASEQANADAEIQLRVADTRNSEAKVKRRTALGLRRHAARLRLSAVEQEITISARLHEESIRNMHLWAAAIPLSEALRHEKAAQTILDELQAKKTDAKPLYDTLAAQADAYNSALRFRLATLQKLHDAAVEAARQERTSKQTQNEAITKNREGAARIRGRADNLRGQLARGEKALHALRVKETILPNEDAEHASARWAGEAARQQDLARTHLAQQAALATERQQLDDNIQTIAATLQRDHAKEETIVKELARAQTARDRLRSHSGLRRVFELGDVDVEQLGADADTRLSNALRIATDEVVRLRLEGAADERALAHLRENGLLPPSPDAQRIIRILEAKLPWVKSGWLAIETVIPPDAAQRRAFVQRAPHLALGVIVRDADYEKAQDILREAGIHPELPITLAPQGALLEPPPTAGHVLAPRTHAYFDAGDARIELERLTRTNATHERAIKNANETRTEIEHAKSQYEAYRTLHPRGWVAAQEAELRAIRSERARVEADKTRITLAIDENQREQTRLIAAARAADAAVATAQTRAVEATRHNDEYEKHYAEWRADLEFAMNELTRLQAEEAVLRARLARCEELATQREEEARDLDRDIVRLDGDLRRIAYLPKDARPPEEANIEDRRVAYETAKNAYELKVDEVGLRRIYDNERSEAQNAWGTFKKKLRNYSEHEVREKLGTLPSNADIQDQYTNAVQNEASERGRHGNNGKARDRALEALGDIQKQIDEITDVPEILPRELPAGETTAEAQATTADAEAARLEAEAQVARQEHEKLRSAGMNAQAQAELRAAESADLSKQLTAYEDILLLPPALRPSLTWAPPESDSEIKSRIDDLNDCLVRLRSTKRALDTKRRGLVRAVKDFARSDDYARLGTKLPDQLDRYEEHEMEERAERLADDLRLRAKTIVAALEDMDKHRELLINEVLHAAEEGLAVLRAASTQSKLPEHVQGFGGSHFLKINTSDPDATQARRDRVGQLIDQIVDEDEVPDGMRLIQRAVRQLANPIRVSVLFPDADHGREWVPIEEITKTSGGEKITSAVLLYCTLAQLRAKQSGRRRPRTMCLLDNPFGTASRKKFVDLQLAVARAMNVQLIYTTGILDDEAISPFPRLIQLKNEKMDRNSGNHFIERDEALGQLDAAHLGRQTTIPRGEPHA